MSDWQEKSLSLSWEQYRNQAFELGKKLEGRPFDLIVAIARGGLTLSQLLSDHLSLPIASFTIKSYKDFKQNSEPQITYELGAKLENKKVLLVDDVSDTGKTFIRGIEYLVEEGARKENITTASLHYKPHSVYKPDFFAGETSKWVIYPYEVLEAIETLWPLWRKERISKEEIVQRFILFHFNKEHIAQFLKKDLN